jgi:hypothetical protein
LRHAFDDVNQNDIAEFFVSQTLRSRRSDIARADYGYFFPCHLSSRISCQQPEVS